MTLGQMASLESRESKRSVRECYSFRVTLVRALGVTNQMKGFPSGTRAHHSCVTNPTQLADFRAQHSDTKTRVRCTQVQHMRRCLGLLGESANLSNRTASLGIRSVNPNSVVNTNTNPCGRSQQLQKRYKHAQDIQNCTIQEKKSRT